MALLREQLWLISPKIKAGYLSWEYRGTMGVPYLGDNFPLRAPSSYPVPSPRNPSIMALKRCTWVSKPRYHRGSVGPLHVPGSKVAIYGMVIPPLMTESLQWGPINPYYWVDEFIHYCR